MKRIMTLILAAGLVFGTVNGALAIDFDMKGQWIFGFGAVDSAFATKVDGKRTPAATSDTFGALQRLRLQMDAMASESLSGTVFFEIGDTAWGKAEQGGALGADGTIIELKNAYIDWLVPNTALKFRMGIQAVALPNAAGGAAIMDDDVAGIVASYRFNDQVALTATWMRPYNDNYVQDRAAGLNAPSNFLDNADFFALALPVTLDGVSVTPWAMLGASGKNTLHMDDAVEMHNGTMVSGSNLVAGTMPFGYRHGANLKASRAYSTMFFAGLPLTFSALDPWNFELDVNYGYAQGFGSFDAYDARSQVDKRADSVRQGWLAKGLVEYKLDWGTPGLFAWYASGDDGDIKNGSERMPTISPSANFTSFMGDGDSAWSVTSGSRMGYDLLLSYSGTWGIGAQIKDLSFLEGLQHTLRVAYWGGTNSPSMVKYLGASAATMRSDYGTGLAESMYLTTNDGLLEFNVDSTYKIYDNLTMTLELGYIANFIDKGTWERSYFDSKFTKSDAYKAALIFNYQF